MEMLQSHSKEALKTNKQPKKFRANISSKYLSVIFASKVYFIPAETEWRHADLGEGESLGGEDTRGQRDQGQHGGHGDGHQHGQDTRPGQSQLRAS